MCEPQAWAFITHNLNAFSEVCAKLYGSTDTDRLSEDENPFWDKRNAFLSAVGHSLRIASRQSRLEQATFFEAYAKALRKGSLNIDLKPVAATTRTPAIQIIAVFGPLLRLHFRSVADVHRFLVKSLGSNRAGDIKRTEDICKKLGMKFRPAGRPSTKPRDI
jgi:hypothetical protein